MQAKPLLRAGYTLVELMIAAAVSVVVGGTFYSTVRNMAFLSAKNAAINLTHAQGQTAIHRAITEIRDAVSIPQLIDASGAPSAPAGGPAAGVSYQQMISGPCLVWSGVTVGQSQIVISARPSDPAVAPGMRLIVPAFMIEDDITNVSATSGTPPVRTITLAHPITSKITCANGSPNYVAYFTQRSALIVVAGELRYFPLKSASAYSVVSSNITTPQPFTVPNGDNRFVTATLATQDPRILGRDFKSMNLQLSLTVPYRYRLTNFQ